MPGFTTRAGAGGPIGFSALSNVRRVWAFEWRAELVLVKESRVFSDDGEGSGSPPRGLMGSAALPATG